MSRINTPEYRAWQGAKSRCYNPRTPGWRRYGGRGIAMCDRWRDSFDNFLADMGPRPGEGYSIDRIDNDGNYEPSNCRWATAGEQVRNRSRTRIFEFNGKKMCLYDWAAELGLDRKTVWIRYKKGWPIERVLGPRAKVGRKMRRAKGTKCP